MSWIMRYCDDDDGVQADPWMRVAHVNAVWLRLYCVRSGAGAYVRVGNALLKSAEMKSSRIERYRRMAGFVEDTM